MGIKEAMMRCFGTIALPLLMQDASTFLFKFVGTSLPQNFYFQFYARPLIFDHNVNETDCVICEACT